MKNKKAQILWVAIVVVLAIGAAVFFYINDKSDTPTENTNKGVTNTGEKKTFILTGENFKFVMDGTNNPDMRVKEGDTVRIEFTSTGGFHDWVVDEFNAATSRVGTSDGSTFVEFVADKKGTFEYYCSVGFHRAQGMRGNLIVE